MVTNFDRLLETFKELKIPHSANAPLKEAKQIIVSNNQQGTKLIYLFDKSGRFEKVTFE